MTSQKLCTVISGSYRKHLKELYALKAELEKQNIHVLSPVGAHATNPGEEFIYLDEDPVTDKRLLQDSVFAKIRGSSFLVLANIDGYLGTAAVMEVGYAISIGIQILTVEPVNDPNIEPYTRSIYMAFPLMNQLRGAYETT